jgi:hypothetical protein
VQTFVQTSAPTGWTKGSTHNNKALRLTTGTASSGGSLGFTTVLTTREILQANLPAVNLSHSLTADAHAHSLVNASVTNGTGIISDVGTNSQGVTSGGIQVIEDLDLTEVNLDVGGTTDSASAGVSGTIALGGSGTAMDFSVQYVDCIIATKD